MNLDIPSVQAVSGRLVVDYPIFCEGNSKTYQDEDYLKCVKYRPYMMKEATDGT